MVLHNSLATRSAMLASRVAGSASLLSEIYSPKTLCSRKIGRPRHLTGRMQSIGFARLCRSAQFFAIAYSDGDGLLSKVMLRSMDAKVSLPVTVHPVRRHTWKLLPCFFDALDDFLEGPGHKPVDDIALLPSITDVVSE